MSIAAMIRVWRLGLRSSDKMVLLKLADAGNDDGSNCRLRLSTLARHCSLSERKVQSALRRFEQDKTISITREAKGPHPRTYKIHLAEAERRYPARSDGADDDGEGRAAGAIRGTNSAPLAEEKGCRICTPSDLGANGVHPLGANPVRPTNMHTNNIQTNARVSDGAAPEGAPSPDAPEDQTGNELVNTHWNARQDDIAKALDSAQRCWLLDCIPHKDDGETLTLAVPSRLWGEQIDARIGRRRLGQIVGRQIMFRVTEYAKARRAQRTANEDES